MKITIVYISFILIYDFQIELKSMAVLKFYKIEAIILGFKVEESRLAGCKKNEAVQKETKHNIFSKSTKTTFWITLARVKYGNIKKRVKMLRLRQRGRYVEPGTF